MSTSGSTISSATPSAEDVKRGVRRTAGLAQDNPLGLAIGSVAVGFLAGLMVPATRTENERIGPVADDLKQEAVERGKTIAQQAGEAAKQVGSETASAAQENLRTQAENVKSTAQEQGQELASSAQEKVAEAAPTSGSQQSTSSDTGIPAPAGPEAPQGQSETPGEPTPPR